MILTHYTIDELYDVVFDKEEWDYKLPLYKTDGNFYVFENFHYFQPSNFRENSSYIVAFNNKEDIIGILKYSFYDDFCGMNYIDVHKDYRRHGIATQLIEYFCNFMDADIDIKVSHMSFEGSKAHILDIFKRVAKQNILYDEY